MVEYMDRLHPLRCILRLAGTELQVCDAMSSLLKFRVQTVAQMCQTQNIHAGRIWRKILIRSVETPQTSLATNGQNTADFAFKYIL